MFGFEISVKIDADKRVEFLQVFEMLQSMENHDSDRILLDLYQSVTSLDTFLWVETWNSEASLTHYQRDSNFLAMLGAANVLGQLQFKRFTRIEEKL